MPDDASDKIRELKDKELHYFDRELQKPMPMINVLGTGSFPILPLVEYRWKCYCARVICSWVFTQGPRKNTVCGKTNCTKHTKSLERQKRKETNEGV